MAYIKREIYRRDLEEGKRQLHKKGLVEEPYILKFLEQASLGQVNRGKKLGITTIAKYLYLLGTVLQQINKPAKKLTKKDIETFISNLDNDVIRTIDDKPYKDKKGLKVALKVYLKWRVPDKYPELYGWVDLRSGKRKTPEYLKEEEVDILYKHSKNNYERFVIAVLFDTGARIEEFLNIRYEDIEEPTQTFPYYKIDLKEEYSKTKGRIIGCYWKNTTLAIRDYLNENKGNGNEPIIKNTYNSIRMVLTRKGKRYLNRRVYPHLFRHSSATYYADKLNRQELCKRYGWTFSSNVVDVYISRAGIEENGIKDKLFNTNLEKQKTYIDELETKLSVLNNKLEESNKGFEEFKQDTYDMISKFLLNKNESNKC